jgi:hypothetical protein
MRHVEAVEDETQYENWLNSDEKQNWSRHRKKWVSWKEGEWPYG